MKVETNYTIDGTVVFLKHESDALMVYEDLDKETVFIVDKLTQGLILKIDISCEMSQGCGFVDQIYYKSFGDFT